MFDARALASPPDEAWLWLDMEDHAEFIAGYLPDDLPVLIQYREGRLFRLETLDPGEAALGQALMSQDAQLPSDDPGILQRLGQSDWAT